MKQTLTILFVLLSITAFSQDTFSIIAVDTITGEIGGAGASCIDENAIPTGVLIINDIIVGRGGIHTQALWRPANQQNAHNRMVEGLSPQEIIDWLVANDDENKPQLRQYGIVDTDDDGHPRSAAFTGTNCSNYKNHITGPNYAIQGNILLGQQILDSMEARFLRTDGSLAEKLMSALQGANVPGADTRCLNQGTSSLSAFVRVAKADVLPGDWWCDLLVPSTPYGVEPIDSLQVLFDQWLIWTNIEKKPFIQPNRAKVFPNPANDVINIQIEKTTGISEFQIQILAMDGKVMKEVVYNDQSVQINTSDYPSGLYIYNVRSQGRMLDAGKINVLRY
jgi:uncharacterized Ntn-hydrolase superfamily protein